jgi:spermidine synthase
VTNQTPRSSFWFREPVQGGLEEIAYLCEKEVYSGRSRYQQIHIVDTKLHGRMLFLDRVAQSAEGDEFIYHEMLVHPALFGHPDPKTVLVIGGSEGATVREVFRHPGIERVVMVEIDGELLEVCKRFLTNWHRGSFEDPRLEVVIVDGRRYVETSSERFDTIIVDLSDPFEGSPALFLFTSEFYQLVKERLTSKGSVSVQGEGASPQDLAMHARITNTMKSVFPVVRPYVYSLHSFHRPDAHIFASIDPWWSPEDVVRRAETAGLPLLCFTPEFAGTMFNLPPYLYKGYEVYHEVLTDSNPVV